MKTTQALVLALSVTLAGTLLVGCGSHDHTAQAPAGMNVGLPLSASQAQALNQQYQAHKQQQGQ